MDILLKIGQILVGCGLLGALVGADFIVGVSKAQRMGKAAYSKEQKKKKWKWVLIFLGIGLLGIVLIVLCGGMSAEALKNG